MNTKTFKEISNEWIELKSLSSKYSTVMKYKNIVDKHLIPSFGNLSINDFNDDMFINYFHSLFNQKKYSSSSLLSIRYVFRAIIQYSHQKYQTNSYSFELIKIAKKKNDVTTLSKPQMINLSNYCFNHYEPICVSVAISLYAGLRIGEICALKWEDIHFDESYIHVSKTIQRLKNSLDCGTKTSLRILEPKTQTSKRIVPIPLFLNEYLLNYKDYYQVIDNSFFIITNQSKLPDPRTIQYRFNKLCKQYDFHINFHTLRHSFATTCVMNEVDIKSLSEILGHSSVGTTLNLYVHSSLEFKKQQISKISRF